MQGPSASELGINVNSETQENTKSSFNRAWGRIRQIARVVNDKVPAARIDIPVVGKITNRDFDLVRGGGILATAVGVGAAAHFSGGVDYIQAYNDDGNTINRSKEGVTVKALGNSELFGSEENLKKIIGALSEDVSEADAKKAIPLIEKALKDKGIYSDNTMAYAIAVTEHESDLSPIEEYDGEKQAEELEYDGKIHGHGYLQFTGEAVLKELSEKMGMDFVANPKLLLDPEISARAVAEYFDYKGTAKLANEEKFLDAYATINPGAFESEEEHIWRAPYNIELRAKLYKDILRQIRGERIIVTDDPLEDILKGTVLDYHIAQTDRAINNIASTRNIPNP